MAAVPTRADTACCSFSSTKATGQPESLGISTSVMEALPGANGGNITAQNYAALVAAYPRMSLCGFVFSCFFFVGLILLSIKMGSSIYFEISTPFYVHGHMSYEREDAIKQAMQDADSIPPFFLNESGQIREARLPRQMTTHELRIIYEAPHSENVWDLKHLRTIAEIEKRMLQASGENSKGQIRKYSDYCQLVYKASTDQILNVDNPCRTPLSPIGFLWEAWMPVPYSKNSKWVNPKALKSQVVNCPLSTSSVTSVATETDPERAMLISLLPANFQVDEFLTMVKAGQFCEISKRLNSNLTCDEFQMCFALLHNSVTMQSWGLMRNAMWDYSAIDSYYRRNIEDFLEYWSTYGAPVPDARSLYNVTSGAPEHFVYGTIVQQDDHRRVLAQALPNMVRQVADASFGAPLGGTSGSAVMTTLYFGGPLEDMDVSWTSLSGDALDEQNADFQEWVFNAFHDILMDAHAAETNGLKIRWSVENKITGGKDPMYQKYIKGSIVPRDMRWLLAAFLFVFCFIAYKAQSLFLSCVAMGMIVINVIPTAALYIVICRQTYIGILQILSIFLIMGIGADDVFVLLECYRQQRDENRPLDVDLAVAWKQAAKPMLCTSATTFISFMANTSSSFPGVYTFGFWCCCLIATNYCSVNTMFLAAVGVYDRHFKRNATCTATCCRPNRTSAHVKAYAARCFNLTEFLGGRFFGFIKTTKIYLVLFWAILFVTCGVCALHLEPNPQSPKLLPASDPYMQWTDTVVKHFGVFNNPTLITTKLVFGIDRDTPLAREGTEVADVSDRGAVKWSGLFASDSEWMKAQIWLTDLCDDLDRRSGLVGDNLKITLGENSVQCPWAHLKRWTIQHGYVWPAPTYHGLEALVSMFLRSPNVANPQELNFDRWSSNIFFVHASEETFAVRPQLFTIDVKLNVPADSDYGEGLDLWQAWEDYCESWRSSAPSFLQNGFFFTDIRKGSGAFHWFFVQSFIIKEAFVGIGLALGLACIVLLLATGNVVVSACAVSCICFVVTSVVAFMFCVGWKLGVLEALVLVMVIGLSVDYVIHMADAYLEAPAQDRLERTRFMLDRMGIAVLNGAGTTIGAAGFMCATYITFLKQFGIVILVTVFQSLITSLIFFSAMMALVGPQGTFGNISIGICTCWCRKRRTSSAQACDGFDGKAGVEELGEIVRAVSNGQRSSNECNV